jgi:hypothetical protein
MAMIRSDPPDGFWWTMGSTPSIFLQPLLLPDANFNSTSFKTVRSRDLCPTSCIPCLTAVRCCVTGVSAFLYPGTGVLFGLKCCPNLAAVRCAVSNHTR